MRPSLGRVSLLLSVIALFIGSVRSAGADDVLAMGPAVNDTPATSALSSREIPVYATTGHDLGPLSAREIAILAADEGGVREKVGIVRQLEQPVSFAAFGDSRNFPRVSGGGMIDRDEEGRIAWSVSFTSPGAGALRIHFSELELPEGASIVIRGEYEVRGPYTFDARSTDFWTHAVSGDRATITITFSDLAATERAMTSVTIDAVAHLTGGIFKPRDGIALEPESPSCLVDVSCAASPISGVNEFSKAVAFMSFRVGSSFYTCTGALINNTSGDFTPYFLTENECINNSDSAASVVAYFDYRTPSCGAGAPNPSSLPQTNGSTLLYTSGDNNLTLLRLSQRPSGSRIYLGWTGQDLSHADGTPIFRISHTDSGPQNYSKDVIVTPTSTCSQRAVGPYIYTKLSYGGYGAGSAGAPLINDSLQIVGAHWGVCGTNMSNPCDSTNNFGVVGAFANAFGGLKQYLAPGVVLPPTPSGPDVVLSAAPKGLVTTSNTAGAVDSYTLTNIGSEATTITANQSGNFFTQSPTSFPLAAGASQIVTITAKAMSAGSYAGTAVPNGSGVSNLAVPVRMLAAPAPSGVATAKPDQNRIDIASSGNTATGTATFTNTSATTINGIAVSSEPWLIPQSAQVTIPPGASTAVAFQIDRTKRAAGSDVGSESATLSLVFLSTSPSKSIRPEATVSTMTSPVSVIDTSRPSVSSSTVAPLQPNEVALFVPTVGHVQGSVGVFLSDISIVNVTGSDASSPIKMFYTAFGGSTTSLAQLPPLGGNASLAVADVVKTVFGNSAQTGTLQIRTPDIDKIRVNATIFNVSNPAGTFGSTIPTFRSDRSTAAGAKLFLTGLRRDATAHTNVFIQETSGYPATVTTEFRNVNGLMIGTRTDTIAGFGLLQLLNSAPSGAVVAVITNAQSSQGRVAAYATPVDEKSGDSWAVVDWAMQYGYLRTEPVIIPVAGAVHGANNTYFRTDVWITNSGTSTARATIRYSQATGAVTDKFVTVGPLQSLVYPDVVTSLFQLSGDSVGSITVTPTAGEMAVTSRTFTSSPGDPATFGSSIPAFAISDSIAAGKSLRIGGLDDSTVATVSKKTPATFRTNYGMVETSGQPATVRVSILYRDPRSAVRAVTPVASRVINLSPKQFLTISGLVSSVIGPNREVNFGDLHDVQVQFDVTSDTGAVVFYTSSVDNGSGDSIFRSE